MRMPKGVVEPLFPDGDEVQQKAHSSESGPQYLCVVRVDGEKAFTVDSWQKHDRPEQDNVGDEGPERAAHDKVLEDVPFSGWGALSDNRVLMAAKCEKRRAGWLVLSLTLENKSIGSVQERRDAMVNFMKEFVPRQKKEGCDAA